MSEQSKSRNVKESKGAAGGAPASPETRPEQRRKQFRAIKGVHDILPPDTALWNWFEQTAREVMESYGFREIRLPIFEETELFARSVGADTDIVSKEMYTFSEGISQIVEERVEGLRLANLDTLTRTVEQFERMNESGDVIRSPETTALVAKLKAAPEKLPEIIGPYLTRAEDPSFVRLFITKALFAAGLAPPKSLTLRPEATASVVRAYIEHGMHNWPGNVKLYYVGPMFRRERPQKGRFRQFYQIGAEVLGQTDHPAIDAELVEMLVVLLERCRIDRWTLLVNSIGCADCRPKYVEALRQALQPVKSQMCADCQRRAETNPLRVLDCKVEADQPIIANLPAMLEHLDEPCRAHFQEFRRQLDLRAIPYTIAPRLVRGLDYYMRTTFEITSPALGAQNALVGGGRYDGLSELLGGPPVKGIGFALGEDRFIEAMKDAGRVDASRPVDVFVAWMGAAAYPAAVKLARGLRRDSFVVEVPPEEMKLKKALGLADKLGARYALIVGENELAAGKYTLKRLADGLQQSFTASELLHYLSSERRAVGAVKP